MNRNPRTEKYNELKNSIENFKRILDHAEESVAQNTFGIKTQDIWNHPVRGEKDKKNEKEWRKPIIS